MGIDHHGRKVSAVSSAELELEKSNIKLLGQILRLIKHRPDIISSKPQNDFLIIELTSSPSHQPQDNADIDGTNIVMSPACEKGGFLIWTGAYVKFNVLKAKKDKSTTSAPSAHTSSNNLVSCNALLVSVPSYVSESFTGTLIGTADLSDIENQGLESYGLSKTWEF
jgi:hypothetical protein